MTKTTLRPNYIIVAVLTLALALLAIIPVSGSVTAAKIAAGVITASHIAANTITADRMNVSTLSAISANLGTVTAGLIDGVTVRAGSGDEVTLDSSGVTFAAGTADRNKVKWNDGNAVFSDSNSLQLSGLAGGTLYARSNGNVTLEAGLDGSGVVSLTGSGHWVEAPGIRFTTMTGGGDKFACIDNDGDAFASATICAPPSPSPLADARVEALEKEVAELRAVVAQLLAR